MEKQIGSEATPEKNEYWLLNNQDVFTIENDTSIITSASKFIHEKYGKLDLHLTGTVKDTRLFNDNGTDTLAMKVEVDGGDLPAKTIVGVAGMHYGKNPMNDKLKALAQKGVLKAGTKLDFKGAAITYHLWNGVPLNRNFLMYDIGINRSMKK